MFISVDNRSVPIHPKERRPFTRWPTSCRIQCCCSAATLSRSLSRVLTSACAFWSCSRAACSSFCLLSILLVAFVAARCATWHAAAVENILTNGLTKAAMLFSRALNAYRRSPSVCSSCLFLCFSSLWLSKRVTARMRSIRPFDKCRSIEGFPSTKVVRRPKCVDSVVGADDQLEEDDDEEEEEEEEEEELEAVDEEPVVMKTAPTRLLNCFLR